MILTGTTIAAAAGYIVNEITNSKGGKQAADEISTGIWNWIRPIFIKDDKKMVEDVEKDPENMKAILEYQIKRKAENDTDFDKKLAELVKNAQDKGISSNTINITGNNNEVYQNIKGNITKQTHSGTGDNIAGDKKTYNIDKIDNAHFE